MLSFQLFGTYIRKAYFFGEKRVFVNKRASQNTLFKEIYSEYRNEIFKFCLIKTKGNKETAEDISEDAFTVLLNRLYKGESFNNPKAFLYKTANNLYLKQCEKDKKENIIYEKNKQEESSTLFLSEILPEDFDYDNCAEKILKQLNSSEAELYNLRYKEKKALDECAKALNVNFSTVAMRLSRLKKKLLIIIKETIDEEESEVQNQCLRIL